PRRKQHIGKVVEPGPGSPTTPPRPTAREPRSSSRLSRLRGVRTGSPTPPPRPRHESRDRVRGFLVCEASGPVPLQPLHVRGTRAAIEFAAFSFARRPDRFPSHPSIESLQTNPSTSESTRAATEFAALSFSDSFSWGRGGGTG